MTRLKRIIFLLPVLLVFAGGFYIFNNRISPREAISRVRVNAAFQPAGMSAPPQSKEILGYLVLEKAVTSLEGSNLSLQEKIAELQRNVKVRAGSGAGIYEIRYAGRDPLKAARTVNAIAAAFRDFDTERAREAVSSGLALLDRKIKMEEEDIARLESSLRALKQDNEPDDVDIQLAQKYKEKQARHQKLAQTFTDQYPEIIRLKKEMASLQAQILDAPFHDPETIKQVQDELSARISAHKNLFLERENAKLKAAEVGENVIILSLASAIVPSKQSKISLSYLLVGGILLLLPVYIATSR